MFEAYGKLPPATLEVISPSAPLLQVTLVIASILTMISVGSVKVSDPPTVHQLSSVTVTFTKPEHKPVAVCVTPVPVCVPGSSQE